MKKSSAKTTDKASSLETIEQRLSSDRRRTTFGTFIHSIYKRRRVGPRRSEDPQIGFYVDLHEPYLMAVVVGILLLCVTDAYFTITIIGLGGREVNPLMKTLIDRNVVVFFVVKFMMTAVCLLFTVMHKHFRLFKLVSGYHILYSAFFLYMTLVYYEIGLLMPHFGFVQLFSL